MCRRRTEIGEELKKICNVLCASVKNCFSSINFISNIYFYSSVCHCVHVARKADTKFSAKTLSSKVYRKRLLISVQVFKILNSAWTQISYKAQRLHEDVVMFHNDCTWNLNSDNKVQSREVRIGPALSDQKQAGLNSHSFPFIWGSLVKAQKHEIYDSKEHRQERKLWRRWRNKH